MRKRLLYTLFISSFFAHAENIDNVYLSIDKVKVENNIKILEVTIMNELNELDKFNSKSNKKNIENIFMNKLCSKRNNNFDKIKDYKNFEVEFYFKNGLPYFISKVEKNCKTKGKKNE